MTNKPYIIQNPSHLSHDIPILYNRLSGVYELFTDHESSHHKVAIAQANIQPNHAVLEVACGTGRATLEIAKRLGGQARLVAVDVSTGMQKIAKQKLANHSLSDKVDFQIADARKLPFPDNSFDILYNAYMFDLINYAEIPATVTEFKRILKPGGKIILVNMSKNKQRKTIYESLYTSGLLSFSSGSCRPVMMAPFLQQAGFEGIERIYRRNFSWFVLNYFHGTEIVWGYKEK